MRAADVPLVLDTHVLVWLVEGVTRLRPDIVRRIEKEAAASAVHIAAISLWEVAMLVARQRISLSTRIDEWLAQVLAQPGLALAALTAEIAVDACNLPGDFRSDPADQLIVATARSLGAAVVTHDRRIIDYARLGHVTVVPA